MQKAGIILCCAAAISFRLAPVAWADTDPGKGGCARPEAGSLVQEPPDLYSSNGALNVEFNYYTSIDAENRTLFCFVTPDGVESPTLHVNPGDTINIKLHNRVPKLPQGAVFETMKPLRKRCGAETMEPGSVNMHFHGTNVPPTCHSDEVIHTLVNPGQNFSYSIAIPKDEPPGMYWYHPHVHGFADAAVRGGATGAIVVEGIEKVQPAVAKLPSRILVFRDQVLGPQATTHVHPNKTTPFWDVSLNYVPISFPTLTPGTMVMQPGRKEFWRVVNASADTIADLVLKYDDVVQPVQIAALDGVPTGSQDDTRQGKLLPPVQDVYIPPAGRAEFIVPPLPEGVHRATLETLHINTGPGGDVDTRRTLAVIQPGDEDQMAAMPMMPEPSGPPGPQRFENLDNAKVTAHRHLYFYEIFPDPKDPDEGLFYIVVDGQTPELFDPDAPPAITTTQGAVEDWTIENRTNEVHEFHIHQIHFQVRAVNHIPVAASERQFRDTYQVPYWTGKGPYTSVTLRMDFRGATVGDFVYHCHILDHEDAGMMAIIRVLPPKR